VVVWGSYLHTSHALDMVNEMSPFSESFIFRVYSTIQHCRLLSLHEYVCVEEEEGRRGGRGHFSVIDYVKSLLAYHISANLTEFCLRVYVVLNMVVHFGCHDNSIIRSHTIQSVFCLFRNH